MVPKAEGVAGKGAGGHFLTNFILVIHAESSAQELTTVSCAGTGCGAQECLLWVHRIGLG